MKEQRTEKSMVSCNEGTNCNYNVDREVEVSCNEGTVIITLTEKSMVSCNEGTVIITLTEKSIVSCNEGTKDREVDGVL